MNTSVLETETPAFEVPKGFAALQITSVRHYSETLFSFNTERPGSFRFRSGEFAMIGLPADGKPLLRAYSIASPNWADELEFYSIKIPNGPLTSRLQNIQAGDRIMIRPKPVGTLVFDALLPGNRLFLLSTGTGIAPFASIVRDPEVYEKFDRVILVHTTRTLDALTYGFDLIEKIRKDSILSELSAGKLFHLPCTTRESSSNMGRIGTWIDDGRLADFAGGPLNPETDRIMICGSMDMLHTLKKKSEELGYIEGSNSAPGQFVIEKAFAE